MARVADIHTLMLIVRYTFISILLLLLVSNAMSQEAVFSRKISVQLQDIRLSEALDEVSELAEISFFWWRGK